MPDKLETSDRNVCVVFVTKDKRFSVSDVQIFLNASYTPKHLNNEIKDLLISDGIEVGNDIQFEFLIFDEILVTSLDKFLDEHNEKKEVITIEYYVKPSPPSPCNQFQENDFLSSIDVLGEYVLLASYDCSVSIWKFDHVSNKTERLLFISNAHLEEIKHARWLRCLQQLSHADTKQQYYYFVTCSMDNTCKIWKWHVPVSKKLNKISDPVCVGVCKGHNNTVLCSSDALVNLRVGAICIQDVGQQETAQAVFASGAFDHMIKIWSCDLDSDVDMLQETGGIKHVRKSSHAVSTRIPRVTLSGHSHSVTGIAWQYHNDDDMSSDTLVSCSWDRSIRFWDLHAGGVQSQYVLGPHAFNNIALPHHHAGTQSGLVLAAAADHLVRLYDIRSTGNMQKAAYKGHECWVSCVTWSPNVSHLFCSGSEDGVVKQWDIRNAKCSLYDLHSHEGLVTDIHWTSTQHIFSCSADAKVQIYACGTV